MPAENFIYLRVCVFASVSVSACLSMSMFMSVSLCVCVSVSQCLCVCLCGCLCLCRCVAACLCRCVSVCLCLQPEVARRALRVPSDAGELSQCVPPLHGALVGRLGKQILGSLGHSLGVHDDSCSNMLAYLETCRDKKMKYIKP